MTLGDVMNPSVVIDAAATEHVLLRQGIGSMKYVDVARLCLQDDIRSSRVRVRRGGSQASVSDIGSEALSGAVIAKQSMALECIF